MVDQSKQSRTRDSLEAESRCWGGLIWQPADEEGERETIEARERQKGLWVEANKWKFITMIKNSE